MYLYEWFRCFRDGRKYVDIAQRSGTPAITRTEENIAGVLAVVRRIRRIIAH